MAPGKLDLTWRPTASSTEPPTGKAEAIYRGDTYALVIRLWEDTAKTIPLVLDLGATYTAQVRRQRLRTPTAGAPVLDFVVTPGGAQQNELTIFAAAATTLAIESSFESGYWDVQQNDSGVVTTFFAGKAKVDPDVARE